MRLQGPITSRPTARAPAWPSRRPRRRSPFAQVLPLVGFPSARTARPSIGMLIDPRFRSQPHSNGGPDELGSRPKAAGAIGERDVAKIHITDHARGSQGRRATACPTEEGIDPRGSPVEHPAKTSAERMTASLAAVFSLIVEALAKRRAMPEKLWGQGASTERRRSRRQPRACGIPGRETRRRTQTRTARTTLRR